MIESIYAKALLLLLGVGLGLVIIAMVFVPVFLSHLTKDE